VLGLVFPLDCLRVPVHLHGALVQLGLALVHVGALGRGRAGRLSVCTLCSLTGFRLAILGRLASLTSALRNVIGGRAVAHVLSVALQAGGRLGAERRMGRRLVSDTPSRRFG
jgi:hypothetical protein